MVKAQVFIYEVKFSAQTLFLGELMHDNIDCVYYHIYMAYGAYEMEMR